MAQQQHAADVHPDELCPPNKRYDLMDTNKKVDLDHVQCPPEIKIRTNIIKNHPLRFSIAASSSVTWIYMAQFWHTLKEDGLKYRLRFMLDKRELTFTLDDFRQIQIADEMILQDMIQVSLAEHKSRKEQEARENVALDLSLWQLEEFRSLLESRSDKESPEVEIVQEKEEETTPMVDVSNIVPPVNVDDEEDEITDEVFELRRRVKGKNVEETRISPIPSPTRSPRNLSTLGRYGYLFAHLKKRFMPRTSSDQLVDNLHDVMMETLPSLVKEKVMEQVKKEVPAQDDPHDDAHPEGENSAKEIRNIKSMNHMYLRASSGQVNVESRRYIRDVVSKGLKVEGEVYHFDDGVFDGAFGAVGDEEVEVGEGVVVTSSSLEMLTNNCLGGIMVSLIFLEGLEEKA
ncbi:hypothetical protein Tco_0323032 [Tanacetum coccineum]